MEKGGVNNIQNEVSASKKLNVEVFNCGLH